MGEAALRRRQVRQLLLKSAASKSRSRYLHCRFGGRAVRLHRAIMQVLLGRQLGLSEVVHHIDGDHHNNHPRNLQVMARAGHTSRAAGF